VIRQKGENGIGMAAAAKSARGNGAWRGGSAAAPSALARRLEMRRWAAVAAAAAPALRLWRPIF
jgi:hypothetical protein